MTRIAINGLGRIGRTFMKLALDNQALDIVAANDLADPDSPAYLIQYDSVLLAAAVYPLPGSHADRVRYR